MTDPNTDSPAANDAALASTFADEKIAELESLLGEANEKALRAHAEFENYRKRTQREVADERRYAVVPIVRDLLTVLDNLQRAMEAASATGGGVGLLEGVKLVAAQFESVLANHGCVRIESVGHPFDPNQHQAIAQEPSDIHPKGTVTQEAQVGYKLHDRVIRPAQVFVSTGPATN